MKGNHGLNSYPFCPSELQIEIRLGAPDEFLRLFLVAYHLFLSMQPTSEYPSRWNERGVLSSE